MSDIPAVSYTASESAPAADAAATSAGAGSDSAAPSSKGGDFAVALDNAGPKPVRKPPTNKGHAGSSGGQMPVPGNVSPPPTLLVPLAAPAPPVGAQPVAAGATDGAAASATAIAGATAGGEPGADGSSSKAAAANPQVWVAPALGADPADAGVAPTALADASAKAAGDLATAPLPASPGAATLAGDAAAKAGATPRNLAANAVDKVPGASQVAAANNAATSARTGAAGSANPATGSPWMNDAATQAVNTAALSAAATGVVAASKTDAADMDDLATAATGTAAQAAQVSGGTAVVAPPITAARPASIVSASVLAAASSRATAQTAALISASSEKHYAGGSADALSDTGSDLSAAAAQLSVGSTPSSDATAVPTLKVAAGVDTPEFGQGLSERVSWMLDNNVSSAKLQVNPPQLGPIEVRIALQGDHAQVWLTSHSAVTRDALESSAPKLREMLGAQGFGQVSVDISQRSFQERSTQPQPYDWTPAAVRAPASAAQSTAGPLPRRTSSGAVDAYA